MYRSDREATMADYTQTSQGGFAAHEHPEYAVAPASSISKLTNLAGAAVSLALVVGVGIWGYKLLVRDVSGIPVVRAAVGEMRVRPVEPGGDFAPHQGLSVNSVAAIGTADVLAEELHLAPRPTELADEDQPVPDVTDAALTLPDVSEGEIQPLEQQAPEAQEITAAFEDGSIDSIVAQLIEGNGYDNPLEGEGVPVLASVSGADISALDAKGGLQMSLRPIVRPQLSAVAAAIPVAAEAGEAFDLDAASLPVGTRLVQLGAFDTPEIARAQWGKLNARFAPFMEGKKRIVMEATSGGRTFYRLRAEGFEDIGDARRFCSALVAESVDCIPVVTR
jgi:hypothetical protein